LILKVASLEYYSFIHTEAAYFPLITAEDT